MTTGRATPTQLPAIDPRVVRRVGPEEDLAAVFAARAVTSGMSVTRTPGAGLAVHVRDLLRSLAGARNAAKLRVIVEPGLFAYSKLAAALQGEVDLCPAGAGDDSLFAADVGVTGVFAAVAETGSLVCCSGPAQWRSLSLVPPMHVALVRVAQIRPDLYDLLADDRPGDWPACLTVISGPSKTADIEGILITGVHGPGIVHIVVVE